MVSPANQTQVTVAIGTPGYIPSEQAQGEPRYSSDIYALGIMSISALTGLSPDELEKDDDTNEIVWQKHAEVSQELAEIIDKMVRYDFRQRYSSATQAKEALNNLYKPINNLNKPSSSNTMVLYVAPHSEVFKPRKKIDF